MDKAELENLFSKAKDRITQISIKKEELQKWKKEKRNLFLQFVPSIKELTSQFNIYLKEIEPELNSIYTADISKEILDISSENEKIINSENNSSENFFEELNENIETTTYAKNSEPKNINNIQDIESDELIELIENYLDELKLRENKWLEKKDDIIKRLVEDKNKLEKTEIEIKNILSDLTTQRSFYLRNKNILEMHLINDQKIVKSIPDIKISIENKIKNISDELNDLDQQIKTLVTKEQEITEKMVSNPFIFD